MNDMSGNAQNGGNNSNANASPPNVNPATPDVAAVARLPAFWRHAPEHWFIHAEATFTCQRISANNTRVNHVLTALDEEGIRAVTDLLGYDKPRSLASSIIDKLINAPVASSENLAALQKFLSVFDENISILESLQIPYLASFLLAARCLPIFSRRQFEPENTGILHKVAFTTDICKMYRQIEVLPQYRGYQYILWRELPQVSVKEYTLNTITYGVNSAPYLALRVLRYIADTECADQPEVKGALYNQTYMNDICVGAESLEAAKALQSGLIKTLARSGLQLRKWASNTPELLYHLHKEDRSGSPLSFNKIMPRMCWACCGTMIWTISPLPSTILNWFSQSEVSCP